MKKTIRFLTIVPFLLLFVSIVQAQKTNNIVYLNMDSLKLQNPEMPDYAIKELSH